jgi:hypothetical protein
MLKILKKFNFQNFAFYVADWPKFFLYTRNNQEQYSIVNSSNLSNSNLNPSSKTYSLVHGFTDTANYFWVIDVKNNLLSVEDANVIAVDWEEGAAATNGEIDLHFLICFLSSIKSLNFPLVNIFLF